jgi:hypothetical protein
MKRISWIAGLAALALTACGVEPSAQTRPDPTSPTVSSEAGDVAFAPGALSLIPAATSCKPGAVRLCCPFPNGCSCPGTQDCLPNGVWDSCQGAGQRGQPCP